VLALLLDPRVRTLDVVTAGARETIAVTIDPAAPFRGAVPAQPSVDPLRAVPPAWVSPPGSGDSATVQFGLHGRWSAFEPTSPLPGFVTRATAATGSMLVRPDVGWQVRSVPFGARMRVLTAAGPSGEVPVEPLDPAIRQRSFSFRAGMTAARRGRVLRAVRHANRPVRRLLAQVDGMTTIRAVRRAPGIAGETGPDPAGDGYRVTITAASFRLPPRLFELVVLHELGHVVQSAGLDGAQSRAADLAIPRGGRCRRRGAPTGPCADPAERIADTFAKWALDTRTMPGVGYGVPAPRSFRPFARVFSGFALRPATAPGRG
jgi:hypothetical protein